jgi:hypothetical protein
MIVCLWACTNTLAFGMFLNSCHARSMDKQICLCCFACSWACTNKQVVCVNMSMKCFVCSWAWSGLCVYEHGQTLLIAFLCVFMSMHKQTYALACVCMFLRMNKHTGALACFQTWTNVSLFWSYCFATLVSIRMAHTFLYAGWKIKKGNNHENTFTVDLIPTVPGGQPAAKCL